MAGLWRATVIVMISLGLGSACGASDSKPQVDVYGNPDVHIMNCSNVDPDGPTQIMTVYTAFEIEQANRSFGWQMTEPVPKTDEDNRAVYYYVEMLSPVGQNNRIIADNAIAWNERPLFDEEYRDCGSNVTYETSSNQDGRILYALIPGAVYDRIRDQALDGNVRYPFVRFRPIPAPYRNPNGTLNRDAYQGEP